MDTNKDTTNYDAMEAELKTRFGLLPKEIQDVITSIDYQNKLFEIAKKYKLNYEQLGLLEFHTTLTLLGVTNPQDYEKTLVNELNKKPEEVTPLAADVAEQVYKPIRSVLMSLYQSNDEEEEVTTSEKTILSNSGVSVGAELPKTTPSATVTEDRDALLKSIENPMKSASRPLNEMAKPASAPVAPSSMPPIKPAGMDIPVPRAPYAGTAPSGAASQPIPMTAQPTADILAGKLGGTFGVPAKETDHSIKPAAAPMAKQGGDSYREPIE